MHIQRIPFSQWTEQKLHDTFGLRECPEHPRLQAWLEPVDAPQDMPPLLEALRQRLARHARSWNEEELKLHFIGPLVALIDFEGADYSLFAGRSLTATIGAYELSGVVDGLIARGRYDPVTPYFCLHEYKPEKGRDLDPSGQVLAAMLAARELNPEAQPVYGCYVLGRIWFFVILDAETPHYAISPAFDAASEDIVQIYAILMRLKFWIEAICEPPS